MSVCDIINEIPHAIEVEEFIMYKPINENGYFVGYEIFDKGYIHKGGIKNERNEKYVRGSC